MTAVRVADVTGDAAAAEVFHAVADAIYADQSTGTAPVRASIERSLKRGSFQNSQRIFIAFEGDRPLGRIVARVSPVHRDDAGKPYGLLGFFEAAPRQDVADALFAAGVAWLRENGATSVIGPMDGDTWHRYRVNVGPFARPPFPLEPWNPPYYGALWERGGFRALESYSSKWIDDVGTLLPRLQAGLGRSDAHGVRIRRLDPARLSHELSLVHRISSEIFRDAFLYSPISLEEFLALYAGVERLLDPDLVLFATSPPPDEREVGFVFGYADPSRPAVHYKTIGVLAEWRRSAVAAALSHHVYSNALRKGLPSGNHALMRDDNRSQALDQDQGEVFRRYVLYEWAGA